MRTLVLITVIFLMAACQQGNKKQENVAESSTKEAAIIEETLHIGGMHCDMCVASIEKGVGSLEGVESVQVALNDSTAIVSFDEAITNHHEIRLAIEKRGYKVKENEADQ